ncbi:MAG: SufD family Fe-S cluster assembly protein [Candidatus Buchananbacteria bacterium]|nr:SufD family Fe-S cluster assembly protein [Candidatus Buchananbacteria bacterium]
MAQKQKNNFNLLKTEADFIIYQFNQAPKSLQAEFKVEAQKEAFIVEFKNAKKIDVELVNQLEQGTINLFFSLPADSVIAVKQKTKTIADNFFYYFNLKRNTEFNFFYSAVFQKDVAGKFLINHQQSGSVGNITAGIKAEKKSKFNLELINNHLAQNTSGDIKVRALGLDQTDGQIKNLIKIHPNAKNVESYLDTKILLLSDQCQIQTQPDLEISNDEVKASHSASIGQIDQNAVYYLMSRGLNKVQAIKMITNSFLAEVEKNFV